MNDELIPVTGTAMTFLLCKIAEYFAGARDHLLAPYFCPTQYFCDLLRCTGSWILGSFALMAVTQANDWIPNDMDVFLDHNTISSAVALVTLTDFLVRNGFFICAEESQYGSRFEVVTLKRVVGILGVPYHSSRVFRVKLIADKGNTDDPFPIRVIRKFDLSCCCCAFDGEHLYRASWNIVPFFFTQHSGVMASRVAKYRTRGFVFQPEIGPDTVGLEEEEEEVNGSIASDNLLLPVQPPVTCTVVVRQTRGTVYLCGLELVDGRCPIHP